ncbi:hypothetical protein ACFFNY_23300 [Paenibacillus hodogayensis]|uniref:Uncharacterized protein n=1 Tax=Paenibacillus hodogayensis TaxID=279208 RepID=A0ABV5W2N9_9BACL
MNYRQSCKSCSVYDPLTNERFFCYYVFIK